ncbi:MAG: hypothetical protein EBR82_33520 [Caulobacteraceae bacterium]|nr:hypothetical protein [Caulobacteraceae bacterium]
MAHTLTVRLIITTEQKVADAQPESRLDLIRDAVAERFDQLIGDTIDGIGADGESEYEVSEANIIDVLDRTPFAIDDASVACADVDVEVIINHITGKFAARYELEEAIEECTADIAADLNEQSLGDDDAFVITQVETDGVE